MLDGAVKRPGPGRPRLSDERGLTVVELLIASVIGVIILGSATLITINAARYNNEVANRTDATQRGRLAMERMQRLLRTQVCTSASAFPVRSAKADAVSFYADMSDGSTPVYQHTLTYDAANQQLLQTSVRGSTRSPVTFTAAPVTETLATEVVPSGSNAVFRYYGYPATAPASGPLEPNVELVPPAGGSLSGADLGRIARVDLNFLTTGATPSTRDIRAEMTNQVFVRIADPNDPTSFDPSCS